VISCEAGLSANDVLERRIQKAIEIHEVKASGQAAATDKDCSSAAYLGCAANTWNPSLKPGTTRVQPASYGWTQFTPPALVDALNKLSASDLATLGITAARRTGGRGCNMVCETCKRWVESPCSHCICRWMHFLIYLRRLGQTRPPTMLSFSAAKCPSVQP